MIVFIHVLVSIVCQGVVPYLLPHFVGNESCITHSDAFQHSLASGNGQNAWYCTDQDGK